LVAAAFGIGLARPMRSTQPAAVSGAVVGSVLLAAGAVFSGLTLLVRDPGRASPYFDSARVDTTRVLEHCATHMMLVLAVLLFRPNARTISSTAWRLRENHDNKQRLLTVVASLVVIVIGNTVLLSSLPLERDAAAVVVLCGELLIFSGSCILAAALVGVLLDSISIARTLWRVPVAFRDVVRRAPL
ncbi:MAG: hypothetical protein AAFN41_05840, partial [Planctomycetota bacterium]